MRHVETRCSGAGAERAEDDREGREHRDETPHGGSLSEATARKRDRHPRPKMPVRFLTEGIGGYTKILYEWLSTRVRLSHPNAGVLLPSGYLPWPGGSPISELEILGEGGQLRQRHPQTLGDPPHVAPGRIDASRLHVRDPGRMDVSCQPECFLAQLPLAAELPNGLGEADLRVVGARHLTRTY